MIAMYITLITLIMYVTLIASTPGGDACNMM